jgi:hypothetical protein
MRPNAPTITELFIGIFVLIMAILFMTSNIIPGSLPPFSHPIASNSSQNDPHLVADLDKRYGAEESNPTGNPIGGGAGYSDIIPRDDPGVTYIASDRTTFLTAVQKAQAGDVIYIEESATIDLTGIYSGVTIPGGVTIASNRGYDGSTGGRILQNRDGNDPTTSYAGTQCAIKTGGDNIRITGIRLEGPDTTTRRMNKLVPKYGFVQMHRNVIVDNCEIYGWSYAGVGQVLPEAIESEYSAYIHHNYFHHCQADGLGYGYYNDGVSLIEANFFDYCRHMIAGYGKKNLYYEARYNIFGTNTGNHAQQVDVHPPGGWTNPLPELGSSFFIHHNTFLHTGRDDNIRIHPPYHTSYIDHNLFYRTEEEPFNGGYCVDILYGYENIITENNFYAAGLKFAANDSIVLYRNPEWMPVFERPLEQRPDYLPPLILE